MKTRLCGNCGERFTASLGRCPDCGTHAAKASAEDKPKQSQTCAAHGCPLPGTVSDDTKGEGPWMCSAHRRADRRDWPAITERAKSAGWLWKAICALRTDGASPELVKRISEACRLRDGFESLAYVPGPAPAGDETPGRYAYRLQLSYFAWLDNGKLASVPRAIGPMWWPKDAEPAQAGNLAGMTPKVPA